MTNQRVTGDMEYSQNEKPAQTRARHVLEKRRKSVSLNLTVSLVMIAVLASAVVLSISYYNARKRVQVLVENKADDYISFVTTALEVPMWNIDRQTIKNIGMSYTRNDWIVKVKVYFPYNEVFFEKEKPHGPEVVTRSSNVTHEGEILGFVEIVLSSKYYWDRNRQLLWSSIVSIFFVLLCLIFLTGFFSRVFLKKPLAQLGEIVNSYVSGNYPSDKIGTPYLEFQPFVNVLSDMGERINAQIEQARRSEQKFRSLVETTSDWVWEMNNRGIFTYASPKIRDLLGYEPEQVIGSAFMDFLSPFEVEKVVDVYRDIFRRGQPFVRMENKVLHRDGHLLVVETNGVPIFDSDGELMGYRGISRDITVRKVAEEENKKLREELEQRVIERTAQLETANRQLKAAMEKAKKLAEEADVANRAKSDFLANMSHEIRTPMNAIIGLTGLALKMDLSPKLKNYLSTVRTSAHTLLQIINGILDFSKIEAGKLELEKTPFRLTSVIEDLCDIFGSKAAEQEIELTISIDVDTPCMLVGDPLRLAQVLINLTANALKFTEKGEISVRAASTGESEGKVDLLFSVRDTGIGINQELQSRLFSAFTQSDSSITRKYGGTGLGLAICKHLVELMKGKIWVDSTPGKGSTFYFTAEFELREDTQWKRFDPPETVREKRVLLACQNRYLRDVLNNSLSAFSLKVTALSSWEQMMESASGEKEKNLMKPDIAILDWRLFAKPYHEVPPLLRKRFCFPNLPIVTLAGYGNESAMELNNRGQIDAVVFKPVKESDLFESVCSLLGAQREGASNSRSEAQKDSRLADKVRGKRVLLVEDNAINRMVAMEILRESGIEVESVEDGKAAINTLLNRERNDGFDIVLMDVQMPEMDGFEATRAIRKHERFADLPVIAMTAHCTPEDRKKCFLSGMNDFISKPLEDRELISILNRWVHGDNSPQEENMLKRKASVEKTGPDRSKGKSAFPKQLPGFDVEAGLTRLGNNQALFKKLLLQFAQDYSQTDENVKSALNRGDNSEALRLVHGIKGVAGNLSATELFFISRQLETAIQGGNPEEVERTFDRFCQDLKQVVASARMLEQ